jgi:hypothetical protein
MFMLQLNLITLLSSAIQIILSFIFQPLKLKVQNLLKSEV